MSSQWWRHAACRTEPSLADALESECTPRIGFRAGLPPAGRDDATPEPRRACAWCPRTVPGNALYCAQGCRDDARSHRHANRDAVA